MNEEHYKTNDLALSASLLSLGFKVVGFEKIEYGKVYFIFNQSAELEDRVNEFWLDELRINPKTFFNAQKELKARIYSLV